MLVGIDIVDIDRIKKVICRTPRFLQRMFTREELAYCMQKHNPYPSLAARFAAKEATRKLDRVLLPGFSFHDVEINNGENGEPRLVLHGVVLDRCRQNGIGKLTVSLSHASNQAVAVVVAEKG